MLRVKEVQEKLGQISDPLSLLEGIFALAPVGFQVFDTKGNSVLINDAYKKMFEACPKKKYNIFEDKILENHGLIEQIKLGFTGELVCLPVFWTDSDNSRAIESKLFPVFDKDGNTSHICIVYRDITLEVETASSAAEIHKITQARYQKLFDSEVIGFFLAHTSGKIYDANDAFLKMIGYSREDLIAGRVDWSKLTPEEYSHLDVEGVRLLNTTGNCPPYRKQFLSKDGKRVPVIVGGALVQISSDEVMSFAFDLTELKQLETQFLQSQKMESMGRFAGGIAHDFNNILAVILLNLEQLITQDTDPLLKSKLETIRSAAERGAGLTRQILAFSRKQIVDASCMDINLIVADLKEMLRRMIPETISFEVQLSEIPAIVCGDQSQLEQCILNLIVNARDAMTTGGILRLSVSTVNLTGKNSKINTTRLTPGTYAALSVQDSGIGMSEEVLAQIFEPFFTTKETGKGTGLGLSTVFGIVHRMGGEITVETSLGKGSKFTLYFPVTDIVTNVKPLALKAGAALNETALEGNNRTVLLVEDEPVLRAATALILKNSGFNVIEATNGKEALKLFKNTMGKFDLIVSDVITPEMTGPGLVNQIKESMNLSVPVIYMSGYTAEELDRHGVTQETAFFLEKPFSTKTFLNIVKKAIKAS